MADITAGKPASHWGTHDPAAEPPRDHVAGLPRLVLECRSRLGMDASCETVLAELRERGLEVSLDELKEVWDRGC